MATTTFCCGFECGVIGASGSTAGMHWVASGAAVTTISTTTVRPGSLRSMRVNAAGTQALGQIASGTLVVGRVYVQFATLPTADCLIIGLNSTTLGVRFKLTDNSLYCWDATNLFGGSGVPVVAGVWYRVDFKYVSSTSVDAQVDGVALGQVATGLSNVGVALGLGVLTTSVTAEVFFDDVLLSSATADYPLGPGHVEGFVPNRDGAHTATGTDIVKGTAATPVGAAIINTTTDAFNWVNARPIGGGVSDATRLINQQTLAATEYVEVGFEPTIGIPRAVEALTVDQQAATVAGAFQTKLNDNGTEDVIINRSGLGVITDHYNRKHYTTMPADSAAWTKGRFNNVKARFGYSSDATPDQYWRGIMLEVEFVDNPSLVYKTYTKPFPYLPSSPNIGVLRSS